MRERTNCGCTGIELGWKAKVRCYLTNLARGVHVGISVFFLFFAIGLLYIVTPWSGVELPLWWDILQGTVSVLMIWSCVRMFLNANRGYKVIEGHEYSNLDWEK